MTTGSTTHSEAELKSILVELDAMQAGISRTYGAIYTTFGVVLPALVGIFTFTAKDLKFSAAEMPKVALAFILVFSLGGLWAHSVWMELIRYSKYKYSVLMPRLYRVAGRNHEANYMEWISRRKGLSGHSILAFNLGCWAVLLTVHALFLTHSHWAMQGASVLAIGTVTWSNLAVMKEAAVLDMGAEPKAAPVEDRPA